MFRFFQNLWAAEDDSNSTRDLTSVNNIDTTSVPVNDDGSKYYVKVTVLKTGEGHGPGHASVTTEQKNANDEVVESTHTSYTVTGPIASITGSIGIGSAMNRSDDSEDLKDADAVLRREVSENSYREAQAVQAHINELIDTGSAVYSVAGPSNPIAIAVVSMAHSANEVYAHQKENGGVEVEDLCGIAMGPQHESSPPLEIHNCVSTTTTVLAAAGVDTSEVFHPTGFIEALEKQGFTHVEQDNAEKETISPFMMGGM